MGAQGRLAGRVLRRMGSRLEACRAEPLGGVCAGTRVAAAVLSTGRGEGHAGLKPRRQGARPLAALGTPAGVGGLVEARAVGAVPAAAVVAVAAAARGWDAPWGTVVTGAVGWGGRPGAQ